MSQQEIGSPEPAPTSGASSPTVPSTMTEASKVSHRSSKDGGCANDRSRSMNSSNQLDSAMQSTNAFPQPPSKLIYPRRRSSRRIHRRSSQEQALTRPIYHPILPLDFRSWAIIAFILLFLCHAWLWYCAFEVARSEFLHKT